MVNYFITGGKELKGDVTINASKNSSVAILIASLLNDGKTIIKNMAQIEEVFRIIEVMESIGVKTKWKGDSLEIDPNIKNLDLSKLNTKAAMKTRSIILFIGVLVHRFKKFSLPCAGGCKLGKRTIMPHVYALENLDIKVKLSTDKYQIDASSIFNNSEQKEIIMDESGDTATENAIMAASLIPGKTTIKFASANYQVQDLCIFLQKLGIKIDGIGSTTLVVYGKKNIKKDISYFLIEDPIETMFFISVAIVTKSSITIKRCPIEFLELELLKLKKMGFKYKILKKYKAKNGFNILVDIKTFSSELTAPIEKISARPFPGLNIDNLPFFVPIAIIAKGTTLIHDWVYENRAIYYIELCRLGAKINLADPHRVFVDGSTELKGTEIICPPALRPSAIILVTMLGAKGKSVLKNIYTVERGYTDLCDRLKELGAIIERKVQDEK